MGGLVLVMKIELDILFRMIILGDRTCKLHLKSQNSKLSLSNKYEREKTKDPPPGLGSVKAV